jgi:acetolactate decarboxylase
MSELEFLGALHVDLLRHQDLRAGGDPGGRARGGRAPGGRARGGRAPGGRAPHLREHELFQTSTIEALLGGAFDGDVTIAELLEHGDHGLGTLNGLDGELIVIGGEAWKANLDCTLVRPDPASRTPYAAVVPFSPADRLEFKGPLTEPELRRRLQSRVGIPTRPRAIRFDGHFDFVRVRSVARQQPPYPTLAEAIAHQHVSELIDVSGTMIGFSFPDALDGIEMVGWHLHFVTDDRARGGHALSFELRHVTGLVDDLRDLHVELPPAVEVHRGATLDQAALRSLEAE